MVLLVTWMFGCGASPVASEVAAVELRTWDLPAGFSERLVASLNRALTRAGDDAEPIGRATTGPGGTLVVVAPPRVLDGVDALVTRATSGPAATAPRGVEIAYWVVRGVEQAGDDPRLAEIAPALELIVASDGPMRFELDGSRVLRTLEGEKGTLDGSDGIDVEQVASFEPGSDVVIADLAVHIPEVTELRTRVAAPSGETVVLAQTEADAEGHTVPLYVIVRATVTGPR
jgi:hypothetical protein